MCDIFWNNFEEKFQDVKESFDQSAMISVDCELTGLHSFEEYRPSLFDSGAERYEKLKAGVNQLLVIQLGVTTFCLSREEDRYVARTFTFYLLPTSFLSVDTRFICQASSLCFLSCAGFDFNKLFSEGIPYLSPQQERKLRLDLQRGRPALACNLSSDLRSVLERACWQVSQWAPSALPGQSFKIHPYPEQKLDEVDEENSILDASMPPSLTTLLRELLLHRELRLNFPDIWTYSEDGSVLRIEKIRYEERIQLEREEETKVKEEYGNVVNEDIDVDCLAEKAIQLLLGATKIFHLLVNAKKPIIGHNCLLDLMVLLKQFYCPLPEKYKDFKKVIHRIFPEIYDTKFISFEVKAQNFRELWEINSLPSIYSFFHSTKGLELTKDAIRVEKGLGADPTSGDKRFHDAGWDSYCTGFCFIRLGHLKAIIGKSSSCSQGIGAGEYLRELVDFRNCVNLMQARSPYLKLDGEDPNNFRPPLLHIESRKDPINITKVKWMLSAYGSVDVKKCSTYCATIAAMSENCYCTILKAFSYRDDYCVTKMKSCTQSKISLMLHAIIAATATGITILTLRNFRSRAGLST
ncbi:pre-piRNA 3'-exonuclease trimmer-like isoform X2 [Ischnura elegans]|uniref:pre-piRNA 3'-exonuclease trimmer-like isoform X2 n=1 Tax=Ischnura elegans TaxID=197161 RepID=UPI001ED88E64|nr:pre-piRNA 3'-exonuclease trimmer-like isoform X2 [Ischnura elegans]